MRKLASVAIIPALLVAPCAVAQSPDQPSRIARLEQQVAHARTLSGTIVSQQNESVAGVRLVVRSPADEERSETDENGDFRFAVPVDSFVLRVEGKNVIPVETQIGATDKTEKLRIKVEIVVPPIHESVVIVSTALEPAIENRNDTIYKNTLFARDDQILFTSNAGIGDLNEQAN